MKDKDNLINQCAASGQMSAKQIAEEFDVIDSGGCAPPIMASHASKPVIDYVSMSGPELLQAVGDDAYKWAEAFCQIKAARRWTLDDMDEGLMVAWFANAIEGSSDVRRWRREKAEKGDTSCPVPNLI